MVESINAEFPNTTYDATIKLEYLSAHRDKLTILAKTGCLFVTIDVEEIDDKVLGKLENRYIPANFVEAVDSARTAGLKLSPTFFPFHPWAKPSDYFDQ